MCSADLYIDVDVYGRKNGIRGVMYRGKRRKRKREKEREREREREKEGEN